jgi:hypothetical protein
MRRKLSYLSLSGLLVLLAIQPSTGQEIKRSENMYRLPADYCLSMKVIQSQSPLQFENIDIFVEKTAKAPFLGWRLKNNSSKTVKRFVVAFRTLTNIEQWRGFGGGQTELDIGVNEKNDLILPNEIYQEGNYSVNSSLPEGVQSLFSRKTTSDDKKFVVVYGMIKKVVFSDGSVYEENNSVFREF